MWTPLGTNLILRLKTPETITKGGIAIPTKAQERDPIGLIVGFGPKVEPPLNQTGTIVFFESFYAWELPLSSDQPKTVRYVVLPAQHVLCVQQAPVKMPKSNGFPSPVLKYVPCETQNEDKS